MSENKFSTGEIVRVRPTAGRALLEPYRHPYFRVTAVYYGPLCYDVMAPDYKYVLALSLEEGHLEKVTEFEQIMLNIEQGILNDK